MRASSMALMELFERCGSTSLCRWSRCAASSASWRSSCRGWRVERGVWLGFALVLFGAVTGLVGMQATAGGPACCPTTDSPDSFPSGRCNLAFSQS